ncbi:MAG TPA: hypothetical protein VFK82_03570 [Burkholderiaceae bacterium]|nr:hypothetical protein [Burkholderiaceae bacterium]
MSDLFAELEALKGGGGPGPSPALLRQLRALPGVRENARQRFAIDAGVELRFEVKDGAVTALLDERGRVHRFTLAGPTDERKLLDAVRRLGSRREDD